MADLQLHLTQKQAKSKKKLVVTKMPANIILLCVAYFLSPFKDRTEAAKNFLATDEQWQTRAPIWAGSAYICGPSSILLIFYGWERVVHRFHVSPLEYDPLK